MAGHEQCYHANNCSLSSLSSALSLQPKEIHATKPTTNTMPWEVVISNRPAPPLLKQRLSFSG